MTIILNRPNRLDSFDDAVHQQLTDYLKQAERDDAIHCPPITGAGRGSCAGQDLNDRNVDSSDPTSDLDVSVERFYNLLIRHLAALPKPVICAVNGVAAGVGAMLAIGCDIVLAARSAKLAAASSRSGLMPDCSKDWILSCVADRARTVGLLVLGDNPNAEQVAQWGIVWQVVDDAELRDTTLTMTRRFTTQPTCGLGLIEKALQLSGTNTLDQRLELEHDYQRMTGCSDDYREGVGAFFGKHPPQFSGE